MKNIRIDIKGEDLKKKLKIKDGVDGKNGRDGKDGKDGISPIIDTENIALEASKLAQVELEKQIPTIPQIVDKVSENIPTLNTQIRDGLELLQGAERLQRTAIDGLDDYEEISKLAREPKQEIKKYYGSGGGKAQNLQSVTDNGATTTNIITGKAQPTFNYTSGQLTNITYDNGTTKDFTYNIDGTLDTLTVTYPDSSTVTKTFVWSSGVLQSINII